MVVAEITVSRTVRYNKRVLPCILKKYYSEKLRPHKYSISSNFPLGKTDMLQ